MNIKLIRQWFLLIVLMTTTALVWAHNKVVVIPMAGDEIEIIPEPFAPLTKQSPPDSDYTIGALTVIDKITGLEWQRLDDNTPRTWVDAFQYCIDLSLDSKTDWRLPLVAELQSIVDYELSSPSINEVAFPGTNVESFDFYWSASSVASFSALAWFVHFSNGDVGVVNRPNVFYVRCVR